MILYSVEYGIARITLNRPEKRNALSGELVRVLKESFDRSSQDENVRVVLLTGAGKDFCSGADLGDLHRNADADVMAHLEDAGELADLFAMMRRHPRPIIAAVRGKALAGGCGLATACDLVVAAESARFGYPEVNIGFVPAIVMAILRRSLSEKRAFELVTFGEVIQAPQAKDMGLINQVYADDVFDSSVDTYVKTLASKSTSAVSLSKSILYQMDAISFESALAAGVQGNALARTTADARAGIAKFLKKD